MSEKELSIKQASRLLQESEEELARVQAEWQMMLQRKSGGNVIFPNRFINDQPHIKMPSNNRENDSIPQRAPSNMAEAISGIAEKVSAAVSDKAAFVSRMDYTEKNEYCPYCGFHVNGMRFCGKCGKQVNN